jgi:hypothetical protein
MAPGADVNVWRGSHAPDLALSRTTEALETRYGGAIVPRHMALPAQTNGVHAETSVFDHRSRRTGLNWRRPQAWERATQSRHDGHGHDRRGDRSRRKRNGQSRLASRGTQHSRQQPAPGDAFNPGSTLVGRSDDSGNPHPMSSRPSHTSGSRSDQHLIGAGKSVRHSSRSTYHSCCERHAVRYNCAWERRPVLPC